MGIKHLTVGSTCPPLVDNKLRIYAMRFCPYAHRALLVAAAKKIPTDIVYINLQDKPEWIFEKNPGGKVPTIEKSDGGILYESLIVADYLDEAYPGPALTAQDPYQKAADRIVIENFGAVGGIFYKIAYLGTTPAEEIPKLIEQYEGVIQTFSKELEKRGTKYFGGNDSPGMLDYMIWPFFERRPVIEVTNPNAVNYSELRKDSKTIDEWVKLMKQDPAVQEYYLTPEVYHTYGVTVRAGETNFGLLDTE